MARTYLVPLQMSGQQILGYRLENLATAPGSPYGAGHAIYNTTLGAPQFYDGAVWRNPFARGDHTGTQLAATISNLAATVQAYPLSSFAVPTANVAFGGFKITGLSQSPSTAGDAAEYSWVLSRPLNAFGAPTANIPMAGFKFTGLGTPSAAGDSAEYSWVIGQIQSAAAGIASKPPARVVATTNQALTGVTAIDGVTLATNDRVLLTAQTTATQNGIYSFAGGNLTRTTVEGPAPGEIEPGAMWLVTEGTTNTGTQWRVATTGTITIGSTNLAIVQFGAGNSYTAGSGITLTGSAFSVNPASGGGIVVAAGGVSVDTTLVTRKLNATIGDGTSTSYTVTHNLGTRDVQVQIYQNTTPWGTVEVDVNRTDLNNVAIVFASAPAANAYRVVVMG